MPIRWLDCRATTASSGAQALPAGAAVPLASAGWVEGRAARSIQIPVLVTRVNTVHVHNHHDDRSRLIGNRRQRDLGRRLLGGWFRSPDDVQHVVHPAKDGRDLS